MIRAEIFWDRSEHGGFIESSRAPYSNEKEKKEPIGEALIVLQLSLSHLVSSPSHPAAGRREGSCGVTRTIGVAASRGGRSSPWGHLPSPAAVVSRVTAINALAINIG